MKKIKTQTMKVTGRFCGVLCVAVLAAFALFAACERPEPDCDLADATTDTLVFVDDSRLTIHHGVSTLEYRYESTEHFLIRYHYEDSTPEPDGSIQYYFRGNDEELILRGTFYPFFYKKNLCFHRISHE